MRYVNFELNGRRQLGFVDGDRISSLGALTLESLLAEGIDLSLPQKASGPTYGVDEVKYLPLLVRPPKIVCVGLNYTDHTKESKYEQPDYPTFFLRVSTSLTAHRGPIVRPAISDSLDFEGELAVVIGRGGKNISRDKALEHVAGYSIFNDGSVREYQVKSPQWTVGKNFDSTGAFGPWLVTADELPAGAKGLLLQTKVNGVVMQSANTSDMIHDVAGQISVLSEAITLEPGDVFVAGTPAGIGWARDPKVILRAGDTVEVSIERIGTLVNTVVDEIRA